MLSGLIPAPTFTSKNPASLQNLIINTESVPPGTHSLLDHGIERKFQTPGTSAPVLEKDTLIPTFIPPTVKKLKSKASIAENMTEDGHMKLASESAVETIVVNEMLRNGNPLGAQEALGRELTPEEASSQRITPVTNNGMHEYSLSSVARYEKANQQLAQGDYVSTEKTLGRSLTGDEIRTLKVKPTMNAGSYEFGLKSIPSVVPGSIPNIKVNRTPSVDPTQTELKSSGRDAIDDADENEWRLSFIKDMYIQEKRARERRQQILNQSDRTYRRYKEQAKEQVMQDRFDPFDNLKGVARNSRSKNAPKFQNSDGNRRYVEEEEDREDESKYDRDSSMGSGIPARSKEFKRLGNFEIDLKKLHHDDILCVRYAKTKHKTSDFPNKKLGAGLKEAIHSLVHGKQVNANLSKDEHDYLHKLIRRSDADIAIKPMTQNDKPDSNKDKLKQLYTMLGEMEAGNDSKALIGMVQSYTALLEKEGLLTVTQAQSIRSAYL